MADEYLTVPVKGIGQVAVPRRVFNSPEHTDKFARAIELHPNFQAAQEPESTIERVFFRASDNSLHSVPNTMRHLQMALKADPKLEILGTFPARK